MNSRKRKFSKKKYLHVAVGEASGLTRDDLPVWDDSFREGCLRVGLFGGTKAPSYTTSVQPVKNCELRWHERTVLEITRHSEELRILLFNGKPEFAEDRKMCYVVAAAGIYLKDIPKDDPIDKVFELFKKNPTTNSSWGGVGGYIRLILTISNSEEPPTVIPQAPGNDKERKELIALLKAERKEREKQRTEHEKVVQELAEIRSMLESLRENLDHRLNDSHCSSAADGGKSLKAETTSPLSWWAQIWKDFLECIPTLFFSSSKAETSAMKQKFS